MAHSTDPSQEVIEILPDSPQAFHLPLDPEDDEVPSTSRLEDDDENVATNSAHHSEDSPPPDRKPATDPESDPQGESEAVSTPNVANNRAHKRRTPYSVCLAQLPADLRKFFACVRKFFTQQVNIEREKAPVSMSTYNKAQERMLCFLGYVRSTLSADTPLTADCFLRTQLIEGYVEFLKEERNCSAATISNHISSLLYPIKFVHREDGPDYKGVLIIRQLRTQARILQKEGDLERPSTTEDLEAQNRWIAWEEVVSAVGSQRSKFELTGPMKFKAKECCDLVLLSLYVFIPPSRGLEIRTLEIVSGDDANNFDPKQSVGKNLLLLKESGTIVLHFNNYKTRKFTGRDELSLQPEEELHKLLASYVKDYRPHLVTESSQGYLLLNKNGDRFSAASFSAHLKSVLYGLTGKLATVNILRSSFITWAYDKSDCTDSMKSSLAAALRHSRRQAQRTYDRRTANQKKRLAVELARDFAEGQLDEDGERREGEEEEEEEDDDDEGGHEESIKPGDFVGVVQSNSTSMRPKVFIGQVQSLGAKGATLLWYKSVGPNQYKLQLTGQGWTEAVASLVPVEVQATKSRAGVYRLLTSPRSIHKAVAQSS